LLMNGFSVKQRRVAWDIGGLGSIGSPGPARPQTSIPASIALNRVRVKSAYETNTGVQTAGLVLGRRHFRRYRRPGKLFLESADQDVWVRKCQEKFGRSPW
jgi:hypothetical protein